MRKWLFVISLVALAPMVAGCASASAKSKPADRPPLAVPPPPPRVIEPAPEPDPVPEPVPDLPPAPAPTRSTRATREPAPKPEPPKTPDTKQGETAATEPAGPPAPVPQATPQLRTPQTADSNEAGRNVRSTIDRANKLLSGVDYAPLNNERKKAYNDAKMFIQQAEDALKQGNFVFAQGVANKAETLGRELAGR
jgi:outer membrane biosynthesis protein TonB